VSSLPGDSWLCLPAVVLLLHSHPWLSPAVGEYLHWEAAVGLAMVQRLHQPGPASCLGLLRWLPNPDALWQHQPHFVRFSWGFGAVLGCKWVENFRDGQTHPLKSGHNDMGRRVFKLNIIRVKRHL